MNKLKICIILYLQFLTFYAFANINDTQKYLYELEKKDEILYWKLFYSEDSSLSNNIFGEFYFPIELSEEKIIQILETLNNIVKYENINIYKAFKVNVNNPNSFLGVKPGTDELIINLPEFELNYSSIPTKIGQSIYYIFPMQSEISKLLEDKLSILSYFKENYKIIESNTHIPNETQVSDFNKINNAVHDYIFKKIPDDYCSFWEINSFIRSNSIYYRLNIIVSLNSNENNYSEIEEELYSLINIESVNFRFVIAKEIKLKSKDFEKMPWYERTSLVSNHRYTVDDTKNNIVTIGLDPYQSDTEIHTQVRMIIDKYKEEGIIIEQINQ